MIPMAFVDSIQRDGDKVKAFNPACCLTPSNSRGLNPIIASLPYTEEFDCIAIAHPIGYHAIWVHPIFLAGYIGDANIVNTPLDIVLMATSLTIISFFLSIDFSFLEKVNKKQYASKSLQE